MSQVSDKKAKILLAALDLSRGDLSTEFTAEALLVAAWKRDPMAFGLRGFERDYPASEVIHREIGKRGPGTQSMVDMGLLDQVRSRVYRLTPQGLQAASALNPEDKELQEKAGRELETRIRSILSHPSFATWLRTSENPKSFREAGRFWGIAPGTPPRVIKDRIRAVNAIIDSARLELDKRGVDEMVDKYGKVLFDRDDLKRTAEFNAVLIDRFRRDLEVLGVEL